MMTTHMEERNRMLTRVRGWIRSLNDELRDIERRYEAEANGEVDRGDGRKGWRADNMLEELYETLGPLWSDDAGSFED